MDGQYVGVDFHRRRSVIVRKNAHLWFKSYNGAPEPEIHEEADRRKTEYLQARGFRVMRVPASETDQGLDDVIEGVWWKLRAPSPP